VFVFLVAVALATGASLPYQDLTPELQAGLQAKFRTAKLIAMFGDFVFTRGIVWVICRRRR
jgi:hypothetical protein